MQAFSRLVALVALALFAATSAGCLAAAAAGVGAAGYAYADANEDNTAPATPADAVEATKAVFSHLQFRLEAVTQNDKNHSWTVRGKTPSGSPVKVVIHPEGDAASRIWVRVGTFGDEDFSRTVLQKILERV